MAMLYIRPTTYAVHSGAQGSIYFNSPLACFTRTAHWQHPKQLLSRERTDVHSDLGFGFKV